MTLRRSLALVLATTIVAITGSLALGARDADALPPDPVPTCAPAPCGQWQNTNVVLSWYTTPPVQHTNGNCSPGETVGDEGVTTSTCSYTDVASPIPTDWADDTAIVRIDRTAPAVIGAAASRAPDTNGWYRAPVQVAFTGNDVLSGIRSCTAATYSAPDSGAATVAGTCTDVAGNTSAASAFTLRYDATGPDVTSGKPARKPDHGRWYTRPVFWRFGGKDALSGLAQCPSVRYTGPDGAAARVVAACRDKAGNVSTKSFVLHYDATAPARPVVRALPRDHAVRLRIGVASDARSITIVRAPGRGGTHDSTIYRGPPKSVTDARARNGTRYRYTVVARDRAANRSRSTVSATAGPRLLAPADAAVLSAPPRLSWTPVRNAQYYNVQLRRDGRKVLSRWPTAAQLQLRGRWRFAGRVRRLVPGRYEWDVWPGFRDRSDVRYGARIGGRSFIIPEAPVGG